MSDAWVRPTPSGLSSAKSFRFDLDARAFAKAEELSLVRADRPEQLLTVERLRGALDDALRTVGGPAATRAHPHAGTIAGTWRWSA